MELHELENEAGLDFDIDVELPMDDAPWADDGDVVELAAAPE